MITFNWFDISLVLIILWSAITGLRSGLARVVIGFVATVVGLMAGFWCYRMLAAELMPWVKTTTVANILAFLLIFIGAMILGAVISSVLSRFFRWIGLSWFNHLLGGVAGFFRGALMIAALVDILVAFSPSPTPAFLERSRVLPYASEVASWLVDMAPRPLKDAFDEQMENLKRLWAQPRDQHSQVA